MTSFSYEEVAKVLAQAFIYSGLIALAVSFIMEFFIKNLITNMKTQTMNIVVCILSIVVTFIAVYTYCYVCAITISIWLFILCAVSLSIFVAGITMNGYDKVFCYLWSGLKKIFGIVQEG